MKVLSKGEVLTIGKNIETLQYVAIDSRYVHPNTRELFTGIGYLLYESGNMDSYAYYKNGILHGEAVEFHSGHKPKEWCENYRGIGQGGYKVWDEDGNLLFDGTLEAGIIIKFKQWDEKGNLIVEKKEPTIEDIEKINDIKSLCHLKKVQTNEKR